MSFTIKHAHAISRVRTTQYSIRTACIVRAGKEMPNADAMALSGRVGALGVGALGVGDMGYYSGSIGSGINAP
jgi:hypothetical protein